MCNNITKKQHYVPRMYLRKFSKVNDTDITDDKRNKMLVYDKKIKKTYGASVYDIATENYFYDIENATTLKEKQILESVFSEMETKFSILLKKITNRCEEKNNHYNALIISKKEREEFSVYIVMQLLRTKKYRKNISKITEKVMDDIVPFIVKDYELKSKAKDIDINDVKLMINEKNLHLESLVDEEFIELLSNFIYNSLWCFIHNQTQTPFIISDNPVCRVPRVIDKEFLYVNSNNKICNKIDLELTEFISPYLDIYFPLSPTVAIRIIREKVPEYEKWKKFKNRLIPVNRVDLIDGINKYQFIMAYEKVFINPSYETLIDFYCKTYVGNNLIF